MCTTLVLFMCTTLVLFVCTTLVLFMCTTLVLFVCSTLVLFVCPTIVLVCIVFYSQLITHKWSHLGVARHLGVAERGRIQTILTFRLLSYIVGVGLAVPIGHS